ncbi:MAG TPA: hypothetical protein GX711_01215 [Clostridia bacterium]|jgi:alpha-tubulin suppressor-like RCC1 family protein|nr:hypothetical protein [Clostridia bacterium]
MESMRNMVLILIVALLISLYTIPAYGMEKTHKLLPILQKPLHTGGNESFFVMADGSLYGCGSNGYSRFPGQTDEYVLTPVRILDNVVAVDSASTKNYAVTAEGDLHTWGAEVERPKKIFENVSSISTNMQAALIVTRNGELYEIDVETDTLTKLMDNVRSASAGYGFTIAVKMDGTAWSWGKNTRCGSLGDGTTEPRYTPKKILDNVKSVSCGSHHTIALKNDGTVWSWGKGDHGELGYGVLPNPGVDDRYTPIKIMEDVKYIDTGEQNSMAIKEDGSLWIWGWGYSLYPGIIRGVPYKAMDDVVAASADATYVLAIKSDGSLWARGSNHAGQFGNGQYRYIEQPQKIMTDVKDISVSVTYSMALKNDGTVWAWGKIKNCTEDDSYAEYRGVSTQNESDLVSLTPVKVFDDAAAIVAASTHRLVLKNDGSLWAWGDNSYGKLGDGTTKDSAKPIRIMDGIKSIGACGNSSAALSNDNVFYSWGNTENYFENSAKPPQKKAEGVIAFSCEGGYVYIADDGVIYSNRIVYPHSAREWQYYPEAEKDAVTGEPYKLPTNTIKLIAERDMIYSYTYAITSDGELIVAASHNDDFFGGKRYKPEKYMDGVKDISGGLTPLIVKTDGTLFRLGEDKPILNNIVRVETNNAAVTEAQTVLALDKNGTLYAWGKNEYGQVGNGISSIYLEPVKIRSGMMVPKDFSELKEDVPISDTHAPALSNADKAEALKPLGVFVGTEKGFELERPATRMEAAVMLTRLLGKEEQAREENNPHTFEDVPEWGGFYVGYLYKNGLAAGVSSTEFGSEGKCTAQMYVTFVLRALGYSDKDGADFTYADALDFAVQIGLISAQQKDEWATREFIRDDLAGISYDALKQVVKEGGQTLSEKLFGEDVLE